MSDQKEERSYQYDAFISYRHRPIDKDVAILNGEKGETLAKVMESESLIAEGAKVYVIDDAELQRVYDSYPVIWKNPDAQR